MRNMGVVVAAVWAGGAFSAAAGRRKYFWLADRELAEAWLKLHNVRGLKGVLPD